MIAITIVALFVVLALASTATLAVSVAKGIAAGREIMAELAGAAIDNRSVRPAILPPLRSSREVSLPKYSRQAVRLRPLRRVAAA
ncbi:MAG: hypothetical protein ABIT10_11190 [Alteraurantiacibacter sp.]